jgi:thioredoxin 1
VRKNIIIGLIAVVAIVAISTVFLKKGNQPDQAEPIPQAPVPGMVTLVDLGAKECIPCKMMAPILEELEKEYQGRAAVIFIDVWKNPEAGSKFGIRTIPTQIFYDAQGKEITRHEGFLDKQSIVYIFSKLGVK